MTNTTGGAMAEDLAGLPTAEAVRVVLQRAVASGIPESDAIDDAFGMLVGRSMELDGPRKTAARLLAVAQALVEMVPPQGARPN
ncbi:hypothetical protein [Methylobacterium sp. CM6257]